MCQPDKHHTNDLAHHQLERLDTAHQQFHNAVGLLFYHALHDHGTVGDNEHIDEQRKDKTDSDRHIGVRRLLLPILIPFDGLHRHALLNVNDNLVKSGYSCRSQFLLLHRLIKTGMDVIEQVGWHLFPATNDHLSLVRH